MVVQIGVVNSQAKMTDAQGKQVTFDQDNKTAFYSGATNTQAGITVSLLVAVVTAVAALL